MRIGAHVSIAGGIINVIPRALAIGANTIQIFLSAPKNWNLIKITDDEAANFKKLASKNNIHPIFAHSIYLVNVASENSELINKSEASLIDYLNTSAKLGCVGVIFHIGSSKNKTFNQIKNRIITHINNVLEHSNPKSLLIIETNAGQGNCIGSTFSQINEILNGINEKSRMGVCLDTAHIYESGYDLSSDPKLILQQFDSQIDLKYLKVIHCNDSKSGLNSKVDRHENIGEGKIGSQAFKQLLHLPALSEIPFILEVPGFNNDGPDKRNIEILKSLAS
ncbi:MAG: deoxyribonuclease IV [bacterium]|nr:deoxyribonuclease IV [bacterium]